MREWWWVIRDGTLEVAERRGGEWFFCGEAQGMSLSAAVPVGRIRTQKGRHGLNLDEPAISNVL